MPNHALAPTLAAGLADEVYAVTRLPTIDAAIDKLNSTYPDYFHFSPETLLKAASGWPLLKCRTAFGFCLLGKGPLEGHAIALFRGTQYLADWLTNFNFTVSRSAYGQPVHDGFSEALRSMKPQLQQFMAQCQGRTLHCIGHSLGGALATICAEWMMSAYRIKPHVYTFGSPRVGLFGFADICTKRIGCDRIFRAYHSTDIVPMIPTWPFLHTPNQGQDYHIPSPGVLPWKTWHDVGRYLTSVDGHSWKSLGSIKRQAITETRIAEWLKESRPAALTLDALEWLNRALVFVLEKCMAGAAKLISQTFTTTFTLMDSIAYILTKGVNLAETVSSWVVFLIRKILILLGQQPAVEAADLTQQYMRAVLLRLQQRANTVAKEALSNVLVKGRAI